MTSRPRAWVSWSSGKDSALALHDTLRAGELEVVGLLTTVDAAADRVAMHDVRRVLLTAQAAALGLPLRVVELPWPCPNDVYEQRTGAALDEARAAGVRHVVFGDLFLEDIRAYRDATLAGSGIEPVYPLWGQSTDVLAERVLALGIEAVTTCVDTAQVPATLCGRRFDRAFLDELPATADPCGENGEFHTFVTDSPDFAVPVAAAVATLSHRGRFAYADLEPA